jgi:hypothetical protein
VPDEPKKLRFLTIEQVSEEPNVKSSLIRALLSNG